MLGGGREEIPVVLFDKFSFSFLFLCCVASISKQAGYFTTNGVSLSRFSREIKSIQRGFPRQNKIVALAAVISVGSDGCRCFGGRRRLFKFFHDLPFRAKFTENYFSINLSSMQ